MVRRFFSLNIPIQHVPSPSEVAARAICSSAIAVSIAYQLRDAFLSPQATITIGDSERNFP